MINSKSLAKQKLFEFLTAVKEKPDEDYHLKVDAKIVPLNKIKSFVHRMRVELSRERKKAISRRNKTPKSFKVLFIRFYSTGDTNIIVLQKTFSNRNKIANAVDDIMSTIDGGDIIHE